jgi:hypothetical protein
MMSTYNASMVTMLPMGEGVDARIRHALFPPLFDHPLPHESVEFTGGLLEAIQAALEVARL